MGQNTIHFKKAWNRLFLSTASYRWYESWFFKTFILNTLLLICALGSTAYFVTQTIEALSRFAHDKEIESTLNSNLTNIKMMFDLQQRLIVEQLTPIAQSYQKSDTPMSVQEITTLFDEEGIFQILGIEDKKSVLIKKAPSQNRPAWNNVAVKWQDRKTLNFLNWKIVFPTNRAYADFSQGEKILKRYQFVGRELEDRIQPAFIRLSLILVSSCFIVLATAFWILSRRFGKQLQLVVTGFQTYAEVDPNYRFTAGFSGELKAISSHFNQMADEVAANKERSIYLEKMASWQIIARKLAHEIKNPLTPIQMMISQIRRKYRGEDQDFSQLLDRGSHIITEEVTRLRKMVDSFSEFAALPVPNFQKVDLVELSQQAASLEQAAFPHHRFRVINTSNSVHATIDPDLIKQVLLNLLKNAGEAAGETPASISIEIEDLPAEISLKVHDNGPGIPTEIKNRIFEAYFSTKHTGPKAGMGLGLAVSQKIIMEHRGDIKVSSQPGHTIFTIKLPKEQAKEQQITKEAMHVVK